MRGFFGILGPKKALSEIVERYSAFKLTLYDTGFFESSQNVNFMSQWMHTGQHPDPISSQLFKDFTVVGWASLYEIDLLKSKLELSGSLTSLELIQHAWNTWGSGCLQHLEGDFSFAIWDHNKEKLFLAKDQIGIRPLFYVTIDDCLVFATTIAALKAAFESTPELNRIYIAHELKNYPVSVDSTFFKDIKRLKPAHFIEIKPGQTPIETRYWDLAPIDLTGHSCENLLQMVRDEMTNAIRRRIEGVKTVGCQLSGGLDSSVIAVLLSQIMDKMNLHTYSFVLSEKTLPYSERGIDEQWSQDLVIDFAKLHRNNHHHIKEFHYKDVFEELDTNNRVMGGLANSDTIWQDTLFKTAAADGVRVSFSGFPGDEGISCTGTNYYYDYLKEFDILGMFAHFRHFHIKSLKHLAVYLRNWYLGITKPQYPAIQKTRNRMRLDIPENKLIQDASFRFNPGFKSGFKEKLLRFHTTLRTESEGAYANQYGIETRYPLVDIRLIQLVYSLPVELFRPKPYTRALFRNICKGLLPEKVRIQPKFSGAMTLAFAEYWHKKQEEELADYQIVDPLQMYLSPAEIEGNNQINTLNGVFGKSDARLKKIDYLITKNL